jgi:hypothetical protein
MGENIPTGDVALVRLQVRVVGDYLPLHLVSRYPACRLESLN